MNASELPSVRMNLFIWSSLILIVISSLLLCGCLEDNGDNPPAAVGTHLELANMGPYIVELNLTDDNEYYIGEVTTDRGYVKTGPPDCFTYSNYTQYQRDILDEMGGNRRLSLDMAYYDVIERTNENLLGQGLSRWPWDESNPYESRLIGSRKWIIVNGEQENEIDAACWIDDNSILSLRMFNTSESDSMSILGSVICRPS